MCQIAIFIGEDVRLDPAPRRGLGLGLAARRIGGKRRCAPDVCRRPRQFLDRIVPQSICIPRNVSTETSKPSNFLPKYPNLASLLSVDLFAMGSRRITTSMSEFLDFDDDLIRTFGTGRAQAVIRTAYISRRNGGKLDIIEQVNSILTSNHDFH